MASIDELQRVKYNGKDVVGCSYKGVSFVLLGSGYTDGRNVAEKTIPNSDTPYTEDTGRSPRKIDVSGVFQDGITSALQQFDTALDAWANNSDIGELVHPERGIVSARLVSISRSTDNTTGAVFFDASFVIASAIAGISYQQSFEQQVDSVSASVLDDIKAVFDKVFLTINQPQHILDSATEAVQDCISVIRAAKLGVDTTEGYQDKLVQTTADIGVLIKSASELSTQLIDLVTFVEYSPGSYRAAIEMSSTTSVGKQITGLESASYTVDQNNKTQLKDLLVLSALTEVSKSVFFAKFESSQDASKNLELVDGIFEGQQLQTTNYQAYNNISTLRKLTIDYLNQQRQQLPAIREYTTGAPSNAIVAANMVYGNSDITTSASDIISRNKIFNPLIIPANSKLEVIL